MTHVDLKGYVYCAEDGAIRRRDGRGGRKLTPRELRMLANGEQMPPGWPRRRAPTAAPAVMVPMRRPDGSAGMVPRRSEAPAAPAPDPCDCDRGPVVVRLLAVDNDGTVLDRNGFCAGCVRDYHDRLVEVGIRVAPPAPRRLVQVREFRGCGVDGTLDGWATSTAPLADFLLDNAGDPDLCERVRGLAPGEPIRVGGGATPLVEIMIVE